MTLTLTSGDTATPALLMTKPTWLVSQVSGHVQRLITERLAGTGARGYHVRVLAALAEFGPASQAGPGSVPASPVPVLRHCAIAGTPLQPRTPDATAKTT